MNYVELLKLLPGIEEPEKRLNFKDKLKWTGIILILFLVMGQVMIWGVDPQAIQRFEFLETIMGSTMGTLVTLGIGPIVTSSIILQLLTGSGIIPWDTNSHEGKIKFMGTQKLLAVIFCIFESIAFVISGAIPALNAAFVPLLILQLTAGGIMIIFMDEVISKWGFGSGISLFIAAGVSKGIFIGALNFVGNTPGAIPATIISLSAGKTVEALGNLIPLIFTIVVFLGVVYVQAMKVEVPLTFGRVSGFGRRWPLKFVYASVIPVILASALLANLRLWGRMLANNGLPILGTFNTDGQPISGLLYFLSPPRNQDLSNILVSYLSGSSVPPVTITWITYTLYLVAAAVIFSVFWVQTAGKDSKSVAEQISNAGLSVPGFRRDIRVIQRVLERYITPLSVMGGVTVGLLASAADFTGALGTGTGILLSVMIVYNLYEEISKQHMEDMHPALRKFMQ
ncbi:MAG: preprotein translocase subunit SecY [Candidatus Aenigmatarchaeota archaeon]